MIYWSFWLIWLVTSRHRPLSLANHSHPNPPISCHHHDVMITPAKGRTNIELREQFILADGVSQSMAAFKPRMSPSSHHGSPSPVPMSSQGPIMKVNYSCIVKTGTSLWLLHISPIHTHEQSLWHKPNLFLAWLVLLCYPRRHWSALNRKMYVWNDVCDWLCSRVWTRLVVLLCWVEVESYLQILLRATSV